MALQVLSELTVIVANYEIPLNFGFGNQTIDYKKLCYWGIVVRLLQK